MDVTRTLSAGLSERAIHVWPVLTSASDATTSELARLLDPHELDRAARFRVEHPRRSFIIARAALRILLGGYIGVPPADVQFKYGAKGKPTLDAPAPIDFNASHSGSLAVFAFTAGCAIGVDVEYCRPLPDIQHIADRFFCAEEAAELMSVPEDQRELAFFQCWTRKEAYIKAIGDGLSAPLDDFRVTLKPGDAARFIHVARDTSIAKDWVLTDLPLAAQYAGALAYRDVERPVVISSTADPAELCAMAGCFA
jgi:4'-phosphopantetheinyl transferase